MEKSSLYEDFCLGLAYEGMQEKECDIYLKTEFIITEQHPEQSQNTLELLASDTIII